MKWFFCFVLAVALGVGCSQQSPASASAGLSNVPATPPGMPSLPTHAQPKLQTLKLYVGGEEITAELALTREQEMTGMMFRTNIEENSGMLFVFSNPSRQAFWMKNCPEPLAGAYIDPSGHISELIDMHAEDTNSIVAKSDNVQYVLEMKEGWFKRHNISQGTLIRTEKGTLGETFFGRQ